MMEPDAPKVEILSVATDSLDVRVTFGGRTADHHIVISAVPLGQLSDPSPIRALEFPQSFYEHVGGRCRELYPVLFAAISTEVR